MEYLRDANERQARQFVAIIAERLGRHGVNLVCNALDMSRNTVYRGRHELQAGEHLEEGRVRKQGGGRKSTLSKHPIFCMDTKKKEILGPFRRDNGTAYCTEPVKVNDHDYSTFSNGKMVPHGIYDVMRNTGYMTFGVSHDTAEFACDCLVEQWEKHLRYVYPSAKCICILCDGGGSNNARSWQFKWCLMETAKRLGLDIRIAHYPPYCSKWNPIEHMLFSQISRVWSGAVFNTIEEASYMAAKTTAKTGLTAFTTINRNIYETKKERNPLFESESDRHIVKDEILPKWNYLVKCN